jgi:NaMN:DMB phosphoribosyltransferase
MFMLWMVACRCFKSQHVSVDRDHTWKVRSLAACASFIWMHALLLHCAIEVSLMPHVQVGHDAGIAAFAESQLVCVGEIGIGNTTAAAALLAAFTGENSLLVICVSVSAAMASLPAFAAFEMQLTWQDAAAHTCAWHVMTAATPACRCQGVVSLLPSPSERPD